MSAWWHRSGGELEFIAGWAVLEGLAAKTEPQIVPPTRQELLKKNDKKDRNDSG